MLILAISGSLRAASVNTSLLRTIARLAPAGVAVELYGGLDDLPHFSPERDSETPPVAVAALRNQLQAADAVLICTPEYAHGVPGVLKNMLDWVVSSGEFVDKPTGVITASTEGEFAHASLLETLRMVSANRVDGASLHIPFARTKIAGDGNITDPPTALAVQAVLDALVTAAQTPGR
jgi:chromate reductase